MGEEMPGGRGTSLAETVCGFVDWGVVDWGVVLSRFDDEWETTVERQEFQDARRGNRQLVTTPYIFANNIRAYSSPCFLSDENPSVV